MPYNADLPDFFREYHDLLFIPLVEIGQDIFSMDPSFQDNTMRIIEPAGEPRCNTWTECP
jgi:hypothetical protein